MSAIIRFTSTRLSSSIASTSSRVFSSSTQNHAAVKGKAKPVLKKKVQGSFMKKSTGKPGASSGGGGDNATKIGGLNVRYSLASDLPNLNDLMELHPESFTPDNIGKATTFPRKTFEQLKAFGLPSRVEKELASGTPTSVIRRNTISTAKSIESGKSSSSKDSRHVITGERGAGKSTLLLQTVSYCLESGWIVLYIPKATQWIDSSAPYSYDSKSKTFHQPTVAQSQLRALSTVNHEKLSKLKIGRAVDVSGRKFEAGDGLNQLVEVGSRDESVAVECMEAVMEGLAKQTDFPVLIAIDEVQALFLQSTYRSSDFTPLESYHLSAPRLALEYLTGRKVLKRGSILTSLSNTSPSYLPSRGLLKSLSLPTPLPLPVQEEAKLDQQHFINASSGLKVEKLGYGMDLKEASGVFEVWSRKGWAPSASDELFLGTFAASAGNPQEFVRGLSSTQQAFSSR